MSGRLKMSIVQAFPWSGRNRAASSTPPHPADHPPPDGATGGLQDPPVADVNVVVIKGDITEEPTLDTNRGAEPVTLLTLRFDAKDTTEHWAPASCTVEVSHQLAARFDGELHKGTTVLVAGQLAGGGDVLATGLGLASGAANLDAAGAG